MPADVFRGKVHTAYQEHVFVLGAHISPDFHEGDSAENRIWIRSIHSLIDLISFNYPDHYSPQSWQVLPGLQTIHLSILVQFDLGQAYSRDRKIKETVVQDPTSRLVYSLRGPSIKAVCVDVSFRDSESTYDDQDH